MGGSARRKHIMIRLEGTGTGKKYVGWIAGGDVLRTSTLSVEVTLGHSTLRLSTTVGCCTVCTVMNLQFIPLRVTYIIVVLDPNRPSASSKTRIASECLASSKMASMFFALSPTHLLSSSPQLTTFGEAIAEVVGRKEARLKTSRKVITKFCTL